MTTFIDTNVIIAALKEDEPHHDWSVKQLARVRENGPVLISDIVYSELSAGMPTQEDVDKIISRLALERIRGSALAFYMAGTAFKRYRSGGGPKTNVLPDFVIGAVAAAAPAPLVTANPGDFKNYFPALVLVHP